MGKIRPDFEFAVNEIFCPLFEEDTVLFTYENWLPRIFTNLEWLISYIRKANWFDKFAVVETCAIEHFFRANAFDQESNLMLTKTTRGKCGFILWAEDAIRLYDYDGNRIDPNSCGGE